jgi:hypothetical protein
MPLMSKFITMVSAGELWGRVCGWFCEVWYKTWRRSASNLRPAANFSNSFQQNYSLFKMPFTEHSRTQYTQKPSAQDWQCGGPQTIQGFSRHGWSIITNILRFQITLSFPWVFEKFVTGTASTTSSSVQFWRVWAHSFSSSLIHCTLHTTPTVLGCWGLGGRLCDGWAGALSWMKRFRWDGVDLY